MPRDEIAPSGPAEVSAVVLPAGEERDPGRALGAIALQTRPPDDTLVLRSRFGAPVPRGAGGEWVWLVDGSVAPEPEALERLLEASQRLAARPPPVLLASKVVTPAGRPEPASLPVPEVFDHELVVQACAQRLLAVRVARTGSLLVRRHALERHGPPRSRLAELEWSARLLARAPGLLVPDSVAVRRPASERARRRQARREAASLARLVSADALAPRDKPWYVLRLADELRAALSLGAR